MALSLWWERIQWQLLKVAAGVAWVTSRLRAGARTGEIIQVATLQ